VILGRHFALAPGLDVYVLPNMLSARPTMAQFVRF
jgi:hypothetical protein